MTAAACGPPRAIIVATLLVIIRFARYQGKRSIPRASQSAQNKYFPALPDAA